MVNARATRNATHVYSKIISEIINQRYILSAIANLIKVLLLVKIPFMLLENYMLVGKFQQQPF